MDIKFKTKEQKLIRVDAKTVAENSRNFLYAVFDFDECWNGFSKKAVFEHRGTAYSQMLTDDRCVIPYEVIYAGAFYVSLIGIDADESIRITSSQVKVDVVQGPSANTENASPSTLTELEQLTAAVDELREENEEIRKSLDGYVPGGSSVAKETDPTVPAWAKSESKPSYTAEEVGARPDTWMPTAEEVGADRKGVAVEAVGFHNTDTKAHSNVISGHNSDKSAHRDIRDSISTALAEAKASGEFDGADGYTPVKGVDYYTPEEKAEFSAYIATELAKRGQLKPEFANNISECTDTTKLYVLPDGYIYAYMTGQLVSTSQSFAQTTVGVYKLDGTFTTGAGYATDLISIYDGDDRIYDRLEITARMGIAYYSVAFLNNGTVLTDISIAGTKNTENYNINLNDILYANVTHFRVSTLDSGSLSCVAFSERMTDGFANTEHAFVPADYEDRITALEEDVADLKTNSGGSGGSSDNPFNGKKIGWIGDSITYGLTPSGSDNVNDRTFFGKMTADALGMSIINKGIQSSTIARTSSGNNPMSERYTELDSDCDVIVVSGGTNDFGKDVDIGTIDDTVNTTFYGALKILCEGLITRYPDKLILFTTPIKRADKSSNTNGKTLKEYVDIIKEVCGLYSIPVLDLWAESGLNPQLSAQSGYFSDDLHPTDTGHEIISRRVVGYFRQLYVM